MYCGRTARSVTLQMPGTTKILDDLNHVSTACCPSKHLYTSLRCTSLTKGHKQLSQSRIIVRKGILLLSNNYNIKHSINSSPHSHLLLPRTPHDLHCRPATLLNCSINETSPPNRPITIRKMYIPMALPQRLQVFRDKPLPRKEPSTLGIFIIRPIVKHQSLDLHRCQVR